MRTFKSKLLKIKILYSCRIITFHSWNLNSKIKCKNVGKKKYYTTIQIILFIFLKCLLYTLISQFRKLVCWLFTVCTSCSCHTCDMTWHKVQIHFCTEGSKQSHYFQLCVTLSKTNTSIKLKSFLKNSFTCFGLTNWLASGFSVFFTAFLSLRTFTGGSMDNGPNLKWNMIIEDHHYINMDKKAVNASLTSLIGLHENWFQNYLNCQATFELKTHLEINFSLAVIKTPRLLHTRKTHKKNWIQSWITLFLWNSLKVILCVLNF